MSGNRYDGVDAYAIAFARIKAKGMIRTGLFSPDDRADIEQELVMDYLTHEHKFAPKKSDKEQYIRMVMQYRSLQMIRAMDTDKRKTNIRELSLDTKTSDDGLTLADLIMDTGELWNDTTMESFADISIQELDKEKIRASLPQDLRKLFDLLSEHKISEIATLLDMPRTTVNRKVKRIREHILRGRFSDYF